MPRAAPHRRRHHRPSHAAQGDTLPQLANRWGQDTLQHYLQLYQSPEAPAAGAPASACLPAGWHAHTLHAAAWPAAGALAGAASRVPKTTAAAAAAPCTPPAGAILTSAYQLFRERVPDPEWAPVVPHFRRALRGWGTGTPARPPACWLAGH